jgi:Glycosyl transferase family 90
VNYLELKDHARYRFLINTDGTVASWRLAKIMHCNSPILKQRSTSIEWYYRSLQPGVHYLEFWKDSRDDIFKVINDTRVSCCDVPGLGTPLVKTLC